MPTGNTPKPHQTLKEYVEETDGELRVHSGTLRRIAEKCRVTPVFLYRVALGHKRAGPELACNVEHFTGGAVNRRTTLPDFPWDYPVPRKAAS